MSDLGVAYVIDDDAGLRAALSSLFRSVGFEVRLFATAAEFLAAPLADAAGCIVLDIRLPGANGLDFQDQLTALGVATPVVLMTGHADVPMSVRGMKAGAVDFLTKPFRDQDMLDAVTGAIERDRERRASLAQADTLRARYATLSPREQQVMALVASGLLNKQVAGRLELSEITVKIHRGAAMRKMGARTLPDLVRMAGALGLEGA